MPATSLKIYIRQPCTQNFGAMPRVPGGLHCASCQKVITDFTCLSDEELIDLLSRPDPQRCGVFSQQQLTKVYRLAPAPVTGYSRLTLLLAGLLTMQPSPSPATVPLLLQSLPQTPGGNNALGTGSLAGKVSNATTRSALPCTIQLYAARQGDTALLTVNTNAQGRYSISLAGLRLQRFFRLVFSSPGFTTRTVVVDRDHLPTFLPVHLKVDPAAQQQYFTYDAETQRVTGGVEPQFYDPDRYSVTGGPLPHFRVDSIGQRQGFWQRLRAGFKRLVQRKQR